MKSKWRLEPLESLCAYISRGSAPSYTDDGGITVINQRCIRDFRIDLSAARRTDPTKRKVVPDRLLKPGDILINSTGVGTLGRVAQIHQVGEPMTVDSHVTIVRPNPGEVNTLYLGYAIKRYQGMIETLGHGSTGQTELSRTALAEITVPVPPIHHQEAISSVLSSIDDKIELNRRMSETLEEILRESHRDWFSSSNAKLLQDSSEAALTSSWAPGSVGDLAYEKREGVNPSMMAPDTPYIGLEHMPRRRITLDMWGTAEGLGSNKYHFERGDILFGKLRPYFHKVGVAPVDGICSTDMVVVVAKEKAYASFLLGVISSDEFVQFTDSSSTGTRMPRTSWKTMASYPIRIPPLALAHAYNDFAEPIIARTINATFENKTLAELRDTLLPKLISGELRVPQAEQLVSEVV